MRVNLSLPFTDDAKALRDRLASLLSALSSRLLNVDERATISGTSTSTYTEVSHDLGRVPTFIHIEPKAQAAWWVTESDRAQWTATKVYLHFDTASVNFTGYVSVLEE